VRAQPLTKPVRKFVRMFGYAVMNRSSPLLAEND